MRFLCDTSVLFAASDAGHRHHQPSLELVTRAAPAEAFVAAHSLAELYATLSGVPAPKMRRLDKVLEAVEHVSRVFSVVTLNADDYQWVLRQLATTEMRGGQVYDALILKCAERAGAELVYTWNVRHFQMVAWPSMAPRIRTPLDE